MMIIMKTIGLQKFQQRMTRLLQAHSAVRGAIAGNAKARGEAETVLLYNSMMAYAALANVVGFSCFQRSGEA